MHEAKHIHSQDGVSICTTRRSMVSRRKHCTPYIFPYLIQLLHACIADLFPFDSSFAILSVLFTTFLLRSLHLRFYLSPFYLFRSFSLFSRNFYNSTFLSNTTFLLVSISLAVPTSHDNYFTRVSPRSFSTFSWQISFTVTRISLYF